MSKKQREKGNFRTIHKEALAPKGKDPKDHGFEGKETCTLTEGVKHMET